MKTRILFSGALCAAAAAFAAAITELPVDPAYPLTAGGVVKAGEPVALDASGRAVALSGGATAVGVALGDATANQTVTVKAGVFGFAASTNATPATCNGKTVYLTADGVDASATGVSNTVGRCIYLDKAGGTAYVRTGF